ncbi:MAG: hypothetical protein GY769_09870 [bacterium]|nr:hypothetical protein [bacterium]
MLEAPNRLAESSFRSAGRAHAAASDWQPRRAFQQRFERLERRIDSLSLRRFVRRTTRVEERALVRTTRVIARSHGPSESPARRPSHRDLEPVSNIGAPRSSRPAATARASHGAPPPPQIDIHSLTDQVVRRIDRRYLAWRERTGRT